MCTHIIIRIAFLLCFTQIWPNDQKPAGKQTQRCCLVVLKPVLTSRDRKRARVLDRIQWEDERKVGAGQGLC